MMQYDHIAVLIPAYQPDSKLLALLDKLKRHFSHIVVVNDGSSEACAPVFQQAQSIPGCRILTHTVNLGKGAALRTGFAEMLGLPVEGVITADADGQHTPEDICKVAQTLIQRPSSLVLGCRRFLKAGVPMKSRLGNWFTKAFFALFTQKPVSDTQTGLRGIPRAFLPQLLTLPGDRYEYEMNMLSYAAKADIHFQEVPIQTVYIDNNQTSHFHPLKDGARIYGQLLRYAGSSLVCAAVDIGLFYLFCKGVQAGDSFFAIGQASLMARAVSAVLNFFLNKRIVFRQSGNTRRQALQYGLLCLVQGLISSALIEGVTAVLPKLPVLNKMVVDGALFVVSFFIQKKLVFRRKEDAQTLQKDKGVFE